MLRHLVTLGIKHQTSRNHVLKGHRIENHRSNGMECKEPATCLVHTLVDEVGREGSVIVNQFFVLKGIMVLGVRHGA